MQLLRELMRIHVMSIGIIFYIAHKELHNCKLLFLFKGSTNTLDSGMPGELHFLFCFIFYSKNTKGKEKVEEKGSLCNLLIFFFKSTSIKVSIPWCIYERKSTFNED